MLYKVEIKEYLSKIIEIEADCVNDALMSVKTTYMNQEIILNENDYVCTEYQILGD